MEEIRGGWVDVNIRMPDVEEPTGSPGYLCSEEILFLTSHDEAFYGWWDMFPDEENGNWRDMEGNIIPHVVSWLDPVEI